MWKRTSRKKYTPKGVALGISNSCSGTSMSNMPRRKPVRAARPRPLGCTNSIHATGALYWWPASSGVCSSSFVEEDAILRVASFLRRK
eukprot:2341664-Prymnesium_polylepis.1